ncbi:MAG: DUF2191 domain-containing protein [Spirochaetae bacterium HGW-Spirochaetae-10]|nr:MAG: DUF2191 domain-containing protein [Spirochaetae bacterium HGW-Spirochaetae-10]
MKTTINLDDELVAKAMELSGIREQTALVNEGLKALLEKTARQRLASLGGTLPELHEVRRRRS